MFNFLSSLKFASLGKLPTSLIVALVGILGAGGAFAMTAVLDPSSAMRGADMLRNFLVDGFNSGQGGPGRNFSPNRPGSFYSLLDGMPMAVSPGDGPGGNQTPSVRFQTLQLPPLVGGDPTVGGPINGLINTLRGPQSAPPPILPGAGNDAGGGGGTGSTGGGGTATSSRNLMQAATTPSGPETPVGPNNPATVPVPGSLWLLGSGLASLLSFRRTRRALKGGSR